MSEHKIDPKKILYPMGVSWRDKEGEHKGRADLFGNLFTLEGVYVQRLYPKRKPDGDFTWGFQGEEAKAPRPRGYRPKAPYFYNSDEPEVIKKIFEMRQSTPAQDKKYIQPFKKSLAAMKARGGAEKFVAAHEALIPEDEYEIKEEVKPTRPQIPFETEKERYAREWEEFKAAYPEVAARADKDAKEEEAFQARMTPEMREKYLEEKRGAYPETVKRNYKIKVEALESLPRYRKMLKAAEHDDYEALVARGGELNFDEQGAFLKLWDNLPYTVKELLAEEFFGKTMEEMAKERRELEEEED